MPTPKKTNVSRGGRRVGAGRKAGGQNVETEDRRLSSAWLCGWFGRRLTSKLGRLASDAECEQAINNCFSPDVPIFQTQKSTLGGMWAKARRGERPLNAERTTSIIAAADRLKFWDPTWRRSLPKDSGESDPLTLLMLSLLSVDGLAEQGRERTEFAERQLVLQAALAALKTGTAHTFERRRAAALAALEGWRDFSSALSAGYVYLQPSLLSSIEPEADDPRRWVLRPGRTINRIAALSFGQPLESLVKTQWQVWALHYEAHNLSDSRMMIQKIKKLNSIAERAPAVPDINFWHC